MADPITLKDALVTIQSLRYQVERLKNQVGTGLYLSDAELEECCAKCHHTRKEHKGSDGRCTWAGMSPCFCMKFVPGCDNPNHVRKPKAA